MQTNLMHENMSTYIGWEQYNNTNVGPHKWFLKMSHFISKRLFKILFLQYKPMKEQRNKFSSGERFRPGLPSACYADIFVS
jgi:hypothetical protein